MLSASTLHSHLSSLTQSYESRMGIAADTEGEGEEDEEVVESPDDAGDDQRIIIKKEGRDSNARRYWATWGVSENHAPVLQSQTHIHTQP